MYRNQIFLYEASVGTSSLTKCSKCRCSSTSRSGPANTIFAVLVVALSKNAPLPPIASILVADPPDPPVPLPITNTSSPSLKAISAFSNDVGFDDPVRSFNSNCICH